LKRIHILFVFLLLIGIFLPDIIFSAGNTNETIKIVEAHCYPNPFKNEEEVTHIKFKIQSDVTNMNATISVFIFDFNGKKVWSKKLAQGIQIQPEIEFEVIWGGENDLGEKVANGLYFCKIILEANNTVYKVIKILVK